MAKDAPAKFVVGGEPHTVYKNKQGHVIVDHLGYDGPHDKFDLTKLAGAHTVHEGVLSTKQWHATHRTSKHPKNKGQK